MARAGLSAAGYSSCARQGEFFILVCARGPAHADAAHNLPVGDDGNAADQGREPIDRGHSCAAFVDQLLKKTCRFFKKDRRTRFADRDGRAHGEGSIKTFECH